MAYVYTALGDVSIGHECMKPASLFEGKIAFYSFPKLPSWSKITIKLHNSPFVRHRLLTVSIPYSFRCRYRLTPKRNLFLLQRYSTEVSVNK
jgi:hypothetical protein